jgi:AcrR family transcriptional regulator
MFAANGYEQTGLREIAAKVGVDAALVYRYFGSKRELLTAVLATKPDTTDILAGPQKEMGKRMAEHIFSIHGTVSDEMQMHLLMMLRAASSPVAEPLLHRFFEKRFMEPLLERLAGNRRRERAMLVSSYLLGASVLRFIFRSKEWDAPRDKYLAAMLAGAIQASIDAPQDGGQKVCGRKRQTAARA